VLGVPPVVAFVRDGRLKALGMTGTALAFLQRPTFAERGVPGSSTAAGSPVRAGRRRRTPCGANARSGRGGEAPRYASASQMFAEPTWLVGQAGRAIAAEPRAGARSCARRHKIQ
jgi:hypothetical protein